MVHCLWTRTPYMWICGQPAKRPVDHNSTLRRVLDHRGSTFGLTRFACQTAFLKMQQYEYRGHIPRMGDESEAKRYPAFCIDRQGCFSPSRRGGRGVRGEPHAVRRGVAPWGTNSPPSGGLLMGLKGGCPFRATLVGILAVECAVRCTRGHRATARGRSAPRRQPWCCVGMQGYRDQRGGTPCLGWGAA